MKNRLQLLEQNADTKYFLEQVQHLGQVVPVFYSTHSSLGNSVILKKFNPDSNHAIATRFEIKTTSLKHLC